MKSLAAEVALHQSTLTRVVEKLEKQDLVHRRRPAENQRRVEVQITDAGKQMYRLLDDASSQMISDLLDHLPKKRQVAVVDAMEELADLLNPGNEAFQKLLQGCRCGIPEGINKTMGQEPKQL
jgi:DNA-binding MarR family transcriptional regulator